MHLNLEVVSPQAASLGAQRRQRVGPKGLTIGRVPGNDWVIPDPYISKQHARITYTNGGFFVEGLGRNPIAIGSAENVIPGNQPRALKNGDHLFIDQYEVLVTVVQEERAEAPQSRPASGTDPFGIVSADPGSDPFASSSSPSAGKSAPSAPGSLIPDIWDNAMPGTGSATGDSSELDPLAALGGAKTPSPEGALPPVNWQQASPLVDHFEPPAPRSVAPQGVPENWDRSVITSAPVRTAPGRGSIPDNWDRSVIRPAPKEIPREPPTVREAPGRDAGLREPREAASREASSRDATVREQQLRELSVRDGTVREPALREPSARGATSRDLSARQAPVRDGTSRELSLHEATAREPGAREAPLRDGTVREPVLREAPVRDGTVREPILREPPARGGAPKEPVLREAALRDGTAREQALRDVAARDPVGRGDATSREAALREPLREPLARESAPRRPSSAVPTAKARPAPGTADMAVSATMPQFAPPAEATPPRRGDVPPREPSFSAASSFADFATPEADIGARASDLSARLAALTGEEAEPARPVSADLAELLRGAGLSERDLSPEVLEELGKVLRVVVEGVMEVLRARSEIKSQFRLPLTRVQPRENNPLKFSPNVESALNTLLVQRNPGYLPTVQAFEDAFADIRNHQIAMLEGLRMAFDAMLKKFDPQELEVEFERAVKRGGLLNFGNGKSKFWELYVERFSHLGRDADDAFRRLFGDTFAEAYERQLERLKRIARQNALNPGGNSPGGKN